MLDLFPADSLPLGYLSPSDSESRRQPPDGAAGPTTAARHRSGPQGDLHAQQSSKLYPTVGDTTDWTFGEYDVSSITVELRPKSQGQGGFILPPSRIQPTFEENQPAVMRC